MQAEQRYRKRRVYQGHPDGGVTLRQYLNACKRVERAEEQKRALESQYPDLRSQFIDIRNGRGVAAEGAAPGKRGIVDHEVRNFFNPYRNH